MKTVHARNIFGENLKLLRSTRGYTQVQFAEILGITQAELSKFEKGARGFSSDSLTEFAERLKCEPWELIAPPNSAPTVHQAVEIDLGDFEDIFEALKSASASKKMILREVLGLPQVSSQNKAERKAR